MKDVSIEYPMYYGTAPVFSKKLKSLEDMKLKLRKDYGITVIRLSNNQIIGDIEYVLKLIEENVKQLIKKME